MKAALSIALLAGSLLFTSWANADIPPPAEPDPCGMLGQGATCWVDGTVKGACSRASFLLDAGGLLTCRPIPVAPSASPPAANARTTSPSGCSLVVASAPHTSQAVFCFSLVMSIVLARRVAPSRRRRT
jgi:hypothetical protein